MKIEVDWQIIEGERDEPEIIAAPPPPRPKRKLPRWLIAVALVPVVAAAVFSVYVTITYRAQLARATLEVKVVAKLEAKAVATNDKPSFMALQDPDDAAFRAMQERRFGRIDRTGLPEFGLNATSAAPQFGSVSLEPGVAELDVMRQFSVTQPMPGGPMSVTLNMPQYYKPTASGWVHALPGPDFWGSQQSFARQHVLATYPWRDADVVEPLVLHMDLLLERVCAELTCPSQMSLAFETLPGASGGWWSSVYGGGETTFTLKILSPHLSGLPTDDVSREELYRAVEIQVVRELVMENWSGQRPRWNSVAYQQLLRWHLAQAGLARPFITPEITSTLTTAMRGGMWQPLSAVSLNTDSSGSETAGDAMVPLAFDFIAGHLGTDSLVKLTPAIADSPTLGDAIRAALRVNPMSLESDWQAYLRAEAGLTPYVKTASPHGELALECTTSQEAISYSILRVGADGSGLTPITRQGQSAFHPAWSPNGKWLAFVQGDQVVVMDANDRTVLQTIPGSSRSLIRFGWLPDGQVWVDRGRDGGLYRVNVDTGQDVQVKEARPIWSPDGKRMAYLVYTPEPIIWIADTDGNHARPVAPGYGLDWSPDGWRMAFVHSTDARPFDRTVDLPASLEIVNTVSDTVVPLTQDLNEINWVSGPAWSPDGALIALTVWRSSGPAFLLLDAHTGEVRMQKRGLVLASRAWSADGRYVAFQPEPDSSFRAAVGILDVVDDRQVSLLGNGWDWSPDGKWLAVTQEPAGVLLTTPDLSVTRWLDTPECSNVAWRPSS